MRDIMMSTMLSYADDTERAAHLLQATSLRLRATAKRLAQEEPLDLEYLSQLAPQLYQLLNIQALVAEVHAVVEDVTSAIPVGARSMEDPYGGVSNEEMERVLHSIRRRIDEMKCEEDCLCDNCQLGVVIPFPGGKETN